MARCSWTGAFVCAAVAACDRLVLDGPGSPALRPLRRLGALVEIVVIRSLYDRDHLDQVLATFALVLMFSEGVSRFAVRLLSALS
jgi:branched-chain amino acid transport system permease protein